MAEKEKQTTDKFQVQREDGSRGVVTEVTTYLIHAQTGHRVKCQVDYFLEGESESLSVDSDPDIFRDYIRGETFRRVR
jgi:hypothetical protein